MHPGLAWFRGPVQSPVAHVCLSSEMAHADIRKHNRILLPGFRGRNGGVFRTEEQTQAGQALSYVRRNCEEQCGCSAVLQTTLVGRISSLSALCGGHLFSRKKLGVGRGAPSFTAHESNAVNARRRCSVIVEAAAVIVIALFVAASKVPPESSTRKPFG